MAEEILFEIENLSKLFDVGAGKKLKAVDGISLKIKKGETFGLVGESGCGKSTLGRTIVRVYEPSSGKILYKGKDVSRLKRKEAKEYTKQVQMIFQDPYASLDPRMTIGDIIKEGMKIHKMGTDKEQTERMYELLELVGLSREHALRFPYEFSGGQRQRVGIARALAVNPEFIVCDEPVSALDVSGSDNKSFKGPSEKTWPYTFIHSSRPFSGALCIRQSWSYVSWLTGGSGQG